MKRPFIKYLPYCGVIVAVTFIFTSLNFIFPISGSKGTLVHLGAAMAVAVPFILPPLYGAVSVAMGMALYDILGGWLIWSPFTFIIRFFQVLVLSFFLQKGTNKTVFAIVGFLLAAIIDVGGYYLAEVLIYGNWIVPFASVPAEIVLNFTGIALGLPVGLIFKRINIGRNFGL